MGASRTPAQLSAMRLPSESTATSADPPVTQTDTADQDAAFETLQTILLGHYRERVLELRAELTRLEALLARVETQINDKDALIDTLTPVIADAITTSIHTSREAMIEALYPITGRLVTRAVSEAMRDLVRTIDSRLRETFGVKAVARHLQAQMFGLSEAEMALRDALPFMIDEIFLIHRDSGLLLRHRSQDAWGAIDSDLISGMLTAIRDFVQDAFGRGEEGSLDEVQYGEKRILIESAKYIYAAVVVEGYEPRGFRTALRERLFEIEHKFIRSLRHYDGDATVLNGVEPMLDRLMTGAQWLASVRVTAASPPRRLTLHRLWWALLGLAIVSLFGWRLWQMLYFG